MNVGTITPTKFLVVTLLAVAMVFGFAAPAQGGTGNYVPRPAECLQSHILVYAPSMYPEPEMSMTGWASGGGGSQVVDFKPHLARFFPGVGWRTVQSGIWKKSTVGDVGIAVFRWTTLDDRSVDSSHYFAIPSVGTQTAPIYYAVYLEYRWYRDATHTGGSTWNWVPHLENRWGGGNQQTYWGCQYPGPNGARMIG